MINMKNLAYALAGAGVVIIAVLFMNAIKEETTGATVESNIVLSEGKVLVGNSLGYAEESAVMGTYKTEAITGTTTITAAKSGTTFRISNTSTSPITLPAQSAGLTYTFVITGAIAYDVTVTSVAGDDVEGSVIVAGAVVDCNEADVLTFVADGENLGDFVTIVSDGTHWYPTQSGVLTTAKLTCSG